MANQYVNKVQQADGTVLMDISEDTVTPETLLAGSTAHRATGEQIQGAVDLSTKADKANTVLTTTLSRGRASGTTVGTGSFAFGNDVRAIGEYSHAEGNGTNAFGENTHAEGKNSVAAGAHSHAEGLGTSAYGAATHASGKYNKEDYPSFVYGEDYAVDAVVRNINGTFVEVYRCISAVENAQVAPPADYLHWRLDPDNSSRYAEVVGNGTGVYDKSNARVLDWDGNEYIAGDMYVGCTDTPDGGTKVATVMDFSDADISVTIEPSDWEAVTGEDYVQYVWSDNRITAGCSVEVFFADGAEEAEINWLDYDKTTGSITFKADAIPTNDLPLIVHVTNVDAQNVASTSADMVSTEAIAGADNVEEALGVLDSNITTLNSKLTKYSLRKSFGTVAASGSKVISSSEPVTIMLYLIASASARTYVGIIHFRNSVNDPIITDLYKGSNITITPSAGAITIGNASSSSSTDAWITSVDTDNLDMLT